MTIIKRADLGRPLTWDELDDNFQQVDDLTTAASAAVSSASASAAAAASSASASANSATDAANSAANAAAAIVSAVKSTITFTTGGTLNSNLDRISDGTYLYYWTGAYPVTVPAGSTVAGTGGIAVGFWAVDNDQILRQELSSSDEGSGASMVALQHGGTVQNLQSSITYDMFNVPKDGSVNVAPQLATIHELAISLGLKVEQHDGVYLLDGTTNIPVSDEGFAFGGATFKVLSTFTGQFIATQRDAPTTYDASSDLVSGINAVASTDLIAGNRVLRSAVNDSRLRNKYCFMIGADDLYQYSGNAAPTKWRHSTVMTHFGLMSIPFKYGVSALTSIYALPIKERFTDFELPCVDIGDGPTGKPLFFFHDMTRFRISGGSVKNKPLTQVGVFHLLSLLNYHDAVIQDVHDPYPTASFNSSGAQAASYTINYGRGDGLFVQRCSGQGFGWGATGGGDAISNDRVM